MLSIPARWCGNTKNRLRNPMAQCLGAVFIMCRGQKCHMDPHGNTQVVLLVLDEGSTQNWLQSIFEAYISLISTQLQRSMLVLVSWTLQCQRRVPKTSSGQGELTEGLLMPTLMPILLTIYSNVKIAGPGRTDLTTRVQPP